MSCNGCNTCASSEKRGCGTSSVFDWLYQIENPTTENKLLLEVQFKSERKGFYVNSEKINLFVGDFVVVEGEKSGHDIGKITMKGELVALQMKRKKASTEKEELKKIYRKALKKDIEKWKKIYQKEDSVLKKAKRIIEEQKLEMKLSEVEFQADNTKATFYYIAEKRVDFRELIKIYSRQFRVKIEMRQIGVRQEAAKIGGIGSCGRELCCSTWMTEFPSVSTSAARYQQLAINPEKISGQCGRLKCCLNFELNNYTEALKKFPSTKQKLKFKKGEVKFFKLDVFKKTISYYYTDVPGEIIEIKIHEANKILKLNKKGVLPEKIEDYVVPEERNSEELRGTKTEDSITRFDKNKRNKKKAKNE